MLDWITPQRDSIRKSTDDLDAALIAKVAGYHMLYEQDPLWLDKHWPILPFLASRPATSAYVNLIRGLILEYKSHKLVKNDGLDFCHAMMGTAFANVASLDSRWKRRVENLPTPNNFARIYYAPQLDKMVSDIEWALESSGKATQGFIR